MFAGKEAIAGELPGVPKRVNPRGTNGACVEMKAPIVTKVASAPGLSAIPWAACLNAESDQRRTPAGATTGIRL